jgi:hypothetical protein
MLSKKPWLGNRPRANPEGRASIAHEYGLISFCCSGAALIVAMIASMLLKKPGHLASGGAH